MKLYYIIYQEVSEFVSKPVRICESFEDAKSHIEEYAGWWSNSKGDCYIEEKNEYCDTLQVWFYRDGEQSSHFDYRDKK